MKIYKVCKVVAGSGSNVGELVAIFMDEIEARTYCVSRTHVTNDHYWYKAEERKI